MPPSVMYHHAQTPLATAVSWVLLHRNDKSGCTCPCCGSLRKAKRYPLDPQLAQCLRRLVLLSGPGRVVVHKNSWTSHMRGGMYSRLRWWGLIEQVTDNPEKPFNKSGEWRPTQLAIDWLQGTMVVSDAAIVDNDELLAYGDRYITFAEALNEPWDPEMAYVDTHG